MTAPLEKALAEGIAYAIVRAPVPTAFDTAGDVAGRLAPLLIESGYIADLIDARPVVVERDKLRMAIRNAIDNIGHGRHGHAIRQLRAARSLFE